MKIILDESVSYGLTEVLRKDGYEVLAVAETSKRGVTDKEIFNLVVERNAILITRDYHFTNPIRFPSEKTGGIIYIRHGNWTGEEEIKIVQRFLSLHKHRSYKGRLVTLYKDCIKIR